MGARIETRPAPEFDGWGAWYMQNTTEIKDGKRWRLRSRIITEYEWVEDGD